MVISIIICIPNRYFVIVFMIVNIVWKHTNVLWQVTFGSRIRRILPLNNSEHYWTLPKYPNSNNFLKILIKFWFLIVVPEFYLKFWFCSIVRIIHLYQKFWFLIENCYLEFWLWQNIKNYWKLPKYQNLDKLLKILIKILIFPNSTWNSSCDRIISKILIFERELLHEIWT